MSLQIPEIKISVSFDKKLKRSEYFKIKSSRDCYEAFTKVFNADTINWCEEFLMLCLNNSNQVMGFYKVSSGGVTGTIVDPKVVFTIALNCCATSIILAHNHPSGKLIPSDADILITKKLKEGAKTLDIQILDHLIITNESFYSFNDEGQL